MTVHRNAAIGFARAATPYERGRPGYPDHVVGWLVDRLGLRPGRTVVDLAAGTGKLTRALQPCGARIIAVDPVVAMVAMLRELTGGAVPTVAATAQALPLATATVDAVTVAQGFHWFASEAALIEMVRVLRADGALALVWNRRVAGDPVQAALSAIMDPYRRDTPSHGSGMWRTVVDDSVAVDLHDQIIVEHATKAGADGLVDRVVSTSFIAALPATERRTVERRVRALADEVGVPLRLPYRCEAYLLRPHPVRPG